VFAEREQKSRDRLLTSGEHVAIRGSRVGYYLCKRCEANRRELLKPWELPADETTEI
jgi:hypothetical protein